MNEKQVDSLIGIIYSASAIMVLIGAFFRLQHYPHGHSIMITGFMLGTVNILVDNFRLKKKIKRLEEQIKQKD